MKVIFLDIDGVLVNRESLMIQSGSRAKGWPSCVEALNHITDKTESVIVVSSTWRTAGVRQLREILASWSVRAKVIDCTPDLSWRRGDIFIAKVRGDEIQEWLDTCPHRIESFVILDDDSDMAHLKDRLIKTEFERGLTMADAVKAIEMLTKERVSVN